MKKNYTKEWKELQADTKVFLEKIGGKVMALDVNAFNAPIVSVRNYKKGYTRAHRISAFNGYGLSYLDKGESKFLEWKNVRDWDLYNIFRWSLKNNKEAFSLWERYEKLLDSTREGFEHFVKKNGDCYYQSPMKLRFVMVRSQMDLYRIGTWGVILKSKNGVEYEDDFTMLDMTSRCKLAEFLAA